jgi:hypothetical protein
MNQIEALANTQWCHEYIQFMVRHPKLFKIIPPIVLYENITLDVINSYTDFPWDWEKVSASSKIPFEVILSNPRYPWSTKGVSLNLNITLEIIKKYPNYPWDWYTLLHNHNITTKMILNNSDLGWKDYCHEGHILGGMYNIVIHKKVTTPLWEKWIKDYPSHDDFWKKLVDSRLFMGWVCFRENDFLTWATIEKYIDFEQFAYMIGEGSFLGDRKRIFQKVLRMWLMASKIQKWFKKVAFYDTTYKKAREYFMTELHKIY